MLMLTINLCPSELGWYINLIYRLIYRWAVSIVMTRQNQIPCSAGKGLHLALIPFLDMCNHCEGRVRQ